MLFLSRETAMLRRLVCVVLLSRLVPRPRGRLAVAWWLFSAWTALALLERWAWELWHRGCWGLLRASNRRVLGLLIRLPYLRGVVDKEVSKELKQAPLCVVFECVRMPFLDQVELKMHGHGDASARLALPSAPVPCEELWQEVKALQAVEAQIYVSWCDGL